MKNCSSGKLKEPLILKLWFLIFLRIDCLQFPTVPRNSTRRICLPWWPAKWPVWSLFWQFRAFWMCSYLPKAHQYHAPLTNAMWRQYSIQCPGTIMTWNRAPSMCFGSPIWMIYLTEWPKVQNSRRSFSFCRSWISLKAVRKHHVQSSHAAERKQAGLISQKDLALTQFGFMGYITLRPHILGVQVSRENYEAFVHFWRVIGHMIGIEDQFNLCTDSWETTKPRLEYLLNDIYRPALENASNSFYEMAYALIDGLWCYNPMLNRTAVLYFTKYLSKCSGYLYYESDLNALEMDIEHNQRNIETLNWATRFMLFFQVTVHGYLINFWLFRWYFNMQVLFYKMLNTHLPLLAMWKFGLEKAYVSIWQEDKTNKQL